MSTASPGRAYISLPLGRRRVIFAATSAKTGPRMSEKLGKLSNGKHKSTLCTFPSGHHEKRTVSKLIVCLQGTFCEAHAPTHASLRMQSRRSEEPGSIGQRGDTGLYYGNLLESKSSFPQKKHQEALVRKSQALEIFSVSPRVFQPLPRLVQHGHVPQSDTSLHNFWISAAQDLDSWPRYAKIKDPG